MEVSNELMAGCGIVERFQNKLVVEHAFVCLRAEGVSDAPQAKNQ